MPAKDSLTNEVNLIKEREKFATIERTSILASLQWIRENMATKQDMTEKLRKIEELEEEIEENAKEHSNSIANLRVSNEQSMRSIEGAFHTAIARLKDELMPLINTQGAKIGDGLAKHGFLAGKFTIAYGLLYLLISGIIGGAITLFFARVQ